MSESRGRSTTALCTLDSIDLEALVRQAPEVQAIFAFPRLGDVAAVAAEVQRLGFAIERAQRR